MTTSHSSAKDDLLRAFGYILGVSYPVLALSTGARSVYQLFFKESVENYVPVWLSALAALCYLAATYGFFSRRPWAWRLSVGALGLETALTLLVGTLSLFYPDLIGRTVWRLFGADYGFFPLFQPLLGLAWLLWADTRRAYGLLPASTDH